MPQGNSKENAPPGLNVLTGQIGQLLLNILKKGKLVYAEGSPEAEGYMNKDNQAAATLRMRVQNLQLLGGHTEGGTETQASQGYAQPASSQSQPAASVLEPADDLPF